MSEKQQTEQTKKIGNRTLNWAVIGVAVVIIVALGLVISNLTLNNDQSSEPELSELEQIRRIPSDTNQIVEKIDRLNNLLSEEKDPDVRQEIYGELTAAYLNNNQKDKVYENLKAQEAEYGLGYGDYLSLTDLAEEAGDIEAAIDYLEKTIDAIPEDDPLHDLNKKVYEERLERLRESNS